MKFRYNLLFWIFHINFRKFWFLPPSNNDFIEFTTSKKKRFTLPPHKKIKHQFSHLVWAQVTENAWGPTITTTFWIYPQFLSISLLFKPRSSFLHQILQIWGIFFAIFFTNQYFWATLTILNRQIVKQSVELFDIKHQSGKQFVLILL